MQGTLLDREIKQAYAAAGIPYLVHIDVTYRCDLDCAHCYLDDKQTWPEMTTAEIESLLVQLRDIGVFQIQWSGGEVFLRPDFPRLLETSAKLGFVNGVKTHAGGVGDERAALLAASRVRKVDVSVYALDSAIHDRITRSPGSLERTLAGIRAMRQVGVAVQVSMVVMRGNEHEVEAVAGFAAETGCNLNVSPRVTRDLAGDPELLDLQLAEAEMVEVFAQVERLARARGEAPHAKEAVHERRDQGPCGAGRFAAYVSPDGAVWPCIAFPMQIGHLRERTFESIWRDSDQRAALVAFTNADRTPCLSCAGSASCSFCPGEAFKESGDYRKAPASFHTATRARLRARELVTGDELGASQWATIPAGAPPREGKASVPMYRPQRGRTNRVQNVANSVSLDRLDRRGGATVAAEE